MRGLESQASAAALLGLSAVLLGLAINHLPIEIFLSAQHRMLSSGTLDAASSAVASSSDGDGGDDGGVSRALDAAIVLGYSVEEGVPTLPLVARVELGVRLFCTGAVRNLVFSG